MKYPLKAEPKIAVFASGSGTNFRSILEAGIKVSVLVVDRPCTAEAIAAEHGVRVERVLRSEFGEPIDRELYTKTLIEALDPYNIDLIVMAGFMTVVASSFIDAYPGRVLNTHPSLLPAFPGAHAVRDALKAGVKVTGCTVHIITPKVDDGPILAQESVAVLSGDTEETLHERIKETERKLYPQVIKEFITSWPNRH